MGGSAWTNELVDLIILSASASGFSGFFAYSPAPGAGNLVASDTAAGGTDPYGNIYLANISSYNNASGFAASLGGGFLTLYTGSLAGGWAAQATVGVSGGGVLFLTAAAGITLADAATAGSTLAVTGALTASGGESVTGGLTTDTLTVTGATISAVGATMDIHNGNVNLNMARPPNYAAVVAGTATAAQVEACLGGLLTSLTNRQLMA
jgi:hypothetical protein